MARTHGIAALQDWLGSGLQKASPGRDRGTLLTGIAVVLGRANALRRPVPAALDA